MEIITLCPLTRPTICLEPSVTTICPVVWSLNRRTVGPSCSTFDEHHYFSLLLSTCEMGDRWVDLITLMLANPPDPNEKLPLSNQRGTIWGTTLTFLVRFASTNVPFSRYWRWVQILALLTASFRLYVRISVVREPGWDDFFLVLSAVCVLVTRLSRTWTYDIDTGMRYCGNDIRLYMYVLVLLFVTFYTEDSVQLHSTDWDITFFILALKNWLTTYVY